MTDTHYENPRLAALYDLDSGWSIDRDFYLALAHQGGLKVLDLGCGTGLLADAYARKKNTVTGVDPAQAMLAVARQKPFGAQIEWVQSPAQTYDSQKRFDLIIMTGHAFQVLLEDSDVLATFAVMKKHLKPGGLIVFESRNPLVNWASRWDYQMELTLPSTTVLESRHLLSMEGNRMRFELRYQFQDGACETLSSISELRFFSREEIEAHLKESGLYVETLLGGWRGEPFEESTSEEMIFKVRAIDG